MVTSEGQTDTVVAILKFLSHLVFEFNAPTVRKDKSGSIWKINVCSLHSDEFILLNSIFS